MSSRRSIMTLFSAPDQPYSHRTRIVLAEKGVEIDIINVVPGRYPEDLLDLNPYHSLPTLVDRDLVLYDSRVIIEYLDEFLGVLSDRGAELRTDFPEEATPILHGRQIGDLSALTA